METSEFGNISWVYYVFGAYAVVAVSMIGFVWATMRQFGQAHRALKEEGFSSDKTPE